MRLRFSNTFGTQPVTFDDAFIGMQSTAGNLAAGSNRRITFARGKRAPSSHQARRRSAIR